jgi:HPt (histidine-containing phosphotransfer) domain-containing protein
MDNPIAAETPVVDREALDERLGGDDDLVAELAVMLAEDARRLAAECAAAAAAGDRTKTRESAHTLKGAAANLCALRVVACAAHLERLAREASADLVGASARVVEEVERLLPALRSLGKRPACPPVR